MRESSTRRLLHLSRLGWVLSPFWLFTIENSIDRVGAFLLYAGSPVMVIEIGVLVVAGAAVGRHPVRSLAA